MSWPGISLNSHHQSSVSMISIPFHIFHGREFRVIGHQSLQEAILHSCASEEHLLPTQRAPGGRAPVVGDTLTPLLLPPPLTNWNHPTSHPQFPRSARASGGLCPPWHLFPGCYQRMRGPPLSEGYLPLLLARGIGIPPVWCHLGIFLLLS